MKSSFGQQFLKNTASNYAIIFLRILLALLTVPVYFHVYGEEQYGIYLLSFGLITSFSFLDFGAGKSLIRYTAEFCQDKNHDKFSEALVNSIVLVAVSAVIVFIILVICGLFADNFFHVRPEYTTLARDVFFIAACTSVIQFLNFIPTYILQGLSVFHKRNIFQLGIIFIQGILLFWVFQTEPPLFQFCIYFACIIVLSFIFDLYLVFKQHILKGIKLKLRKTVFFKSDSFKYSNQIFLLSVVGFLSSQADKLIISAISGISAVTAYSIITKPYYLVKALFANYYAVLQPEFVKTNTVQDSVQLRTLIICSTRVAVAATYIVLLSVGFFFTPLLRFWIGEDSYSTYWLWGVLALFNVFISAFYGSIFRAMFVTGKTNILFRLDTICVFINFITSLILTMRFGWYGVILGTSLQMIIMLFLLLLHAKKHYGIRVTDIITINYFLLLLTSLLISTVIYFFYTISDIQWVWFLAVQCCILIIITIFTFRKDKLLMELI
ncbi:MAG: lipopolysaccharide biosynthesis protein [Chitinophagales bacterium]